MNQGVFVCCGNCYWSKASYTAKQIEKYGVIPGQDSASLRELDRDLNRAIVKKLDACFVFRKGMKVKVLTDIRIGVLHQLLKNEEQRLGEDAPDTSVIRHECKRIERIVKELDLGVVENLY